MKKIIFTSLLILGNIWCNGQSFSKWGNIIDSENNNIELYLISNRTQNYSNKILDYSVDKFNLTGLYALDGENNIGVDKTTSYAFLHDAYLRIKNTDYFTAENRSIKYTESHYMGVLIDKNDQSNFFRLNTPFDEDVDEGNNKQIIQSNSGLYKASIRRKFWRDLFLSVFIQSEIKDIEFIGKNNESSKANIDTEFLTINEKISNVLGGSEVISSALEKGVGTFRIIQSNTMNQDVSQYFNTFKSIKVSNSISESIDLFNQIFGAIEIGNEINGHVLEILLKKSLQCEASENRINTIERWISEENIGRFDSEIINGFNDAKIKYYKIKEDSFKSIETALLNDPELLFKIADYFLENVTKELLKSAQLSGYSIAKANAIFAAATSLIDLGIQIEGEYDILRFASLAATLEEYIGVTLAQKYSTISNKESEIKDKLTLSQINYFLGYYYFKQIQQVYDNKWYSNLKISLLIGLQDFFNTNWSKEEVIEYCEEGVNRNFNKFKDYNSPYYCNNERLYWIWKLINNSYEFSKINNVNFITTQLQNTEVIFKIRFFNNYNSKPASVKLFLDGNSMGLIKSTIQDNFISGVDYSLAKSFSTLGSHNYRFEAYNDEGKTIAKFPENGSSMSFEVVPNVEGWDAGIDLNNSNYVPILPEPGDIINVKNSIRNYGENNYEELEINVKLLSRSGEIIDENSGKVYNLTADGNNSDISLQLNFPGDADFGQYNIVSSINVIDQNLENNVNTFTIYYFEDDDLDNNQFSCLIGTTDLFIPAKSNSNILTIDNTYKYTLYDVNNDRHEAWLKDQAGSNAMLSIGEVQVYSDYYNCLVLDGTYEYNSEYHALVYGGSARINGKPIFDDFMVSGYPGETVSFKAQTLNGLKFEDKSSKYEILKIEDDRRGTPVPEEWFIGEDSDDGHINSEFKFEIGEDATVGKVYRSYFMTSYSNSDRIDFNKIKIKVIAPPPIINTISENDLHTGDEIEIIGSNFGASGSVLFNSIPALKITSWSKTKIICTVPENVETGELIVSNSVGISNAYAYSVSVISNILALNYKLPDITILPGEIKYICDLDNVFSDPSEGELNYYAEIENPFLSYDTEKFGSENILELIASEEILNGSTVKVTASNSNNILVSDEFIVSIADFIKVDAASVEVDASGGNITIPVKSNVDWQFIDEENDWATLTKTESGDLYIVYEPNINVESQYLIIKLYYGDLEESFILVQEGDTPQLEAGEHEINVLSTAGTYTVNVNTNLKYWTATSDQDWAFPGKNGNTLEIEYNSYNQPETREANITIKSGDLSDIIKVIQTGNDCIASTDPTQLNFSSDDIQKNLNVLVNSPWTISSIPEWISLSSESGDGTENAVITVTASNNQTEAARDGKLLLTTECGETSEIVIKQGVECFLEPDNTEFNTDYRPQGLSLIITSNSSWSIENSNDWIQLSKTSGINSDEITIQILENTTSGLKNGTIFLNGCGDPIPIQFNQRAKSIPSIIVTNPSNNDIVSGTIEILVQVEDEDGIQEVEVYLDEESIVSKSGTETTLSIIEDLNTTGYSNGEHEMKVIATDNTGLTNEVITNLSFSNNNSSLESGIVSPNIVETNSNAKFSVVYKDGNNLAPTDVKVFVNGIGYSMNKNLLQNNFENGVEYTLSKTFSNTGEYSYHFEAKDNNGNPVVNYPETGNLNFTVIQNNDGWDLRVTNIGASPSYMTTGQTISATGKVHNNSNTPDKDYSNLKCNFKLYSPDGEELASKDIYKNVNQAEIISASTDITVPNIEGTYNLIFTIYPELDEDLSDNSQSFPIIVGQPGPSRQYVVDESDAWIQLNESSPTYSFEGKQYELTYIDNDNIRISQDGASSEIIDIYDFREFSNKNYVLILEAINNIGGMDAFISFGIQNTDYVTFDETNLTCYAGEKIYFTARCDASTFSSSSPDFYRNETVEDWYTNNDERLDDNHTMVYELRVPNGTSVGEYSFWFATALGNDAKFLRELKITVIPSPPKLNSPVGDSISADDQIVISGLNLGTSGTLKFGGITCTDITEWNSTSITCTVPEGIEDGMITVTNSIGASNALPYYVYSSDGKPLKISSIPDQILNPGETKFVAYLKNYFLDPNHKNLSFSATSTNSNIVINQQLLELDTLKIVGDFNLVNGGTITVKATDPSGKYINDEFVVSVPGIMKVTPLSKSVSSTSGSFNVNVDANINWNYSETSSWLNATKNGNSLLIEYSKNTDLINRSATIRIYGDNVEDQFVTLTQSGITPFIDISSQTLNVTSNAGNSSLDVNSNITWLASISESWLSVSNTNSLISINYNENPNSETRTGKISVTGNGISEKIISVIQEGEPLYLSVPNPLKEVGAETGTVNFSVSTNSNWQINTNSDWISPIKSNNSLLTVDYGKNQGINERTANITISGTGVPDVTLTIVQAGSQPYLNLSSYSQNVSSDAGSKAINVSTNLSWEIQENVDWVSAYKLNSSSFIVYYQKNSLTNSRTSEVNVVAGNNSTSFTLNQSGAEPYIEIQPNSLTISSASGQVEVNVNSNVDWEFSANSDWLSATKTGSNILQVQFQKNNSLNERSEDIILIGENMNPVLVSFTQNADQPYLIAQPSYVKVGSQSNSSQLDISSNLNWSVSDSAEWLVVEKIDEGTVQLSFDENINIASRGTNIFIGNDEYGVITSYLYQEGAEPLLSSDKDYIEINSEAGDTTIDITSNTEWYAYTNEDWLSIEKLNDTEIVINYELNENSENRIADVIVAGWGANEIIIQVQQKAGINTGIFDLSNDIKIYPNPVSKYLLITSSSDQVKERTIEIYNLLGSIEIIEKLNLSNQKIDCSSLKSGIYILRLRDDFDTIKTFKLIKN